MNATPKDWPNSRAGQIQEHGGAPELPPVPLVAQPLLEAFADLGMVQPTGFGPVPLAYAEIAAGVPWADMRERQVLRDMSRAYLSGSELGKDPFGIPPWGL